MEIPGFRTFGAPRDGLVLPIEGVIIPAERLAEGAESGRWVPTVGILTHSVVPGILATLTANGSGLGLAICRSIVEAHGGRIDLESSPNEGTVVTVILPHAQIA